MRIFALLLCSIVYVQAQLTISSPFYVSGVLVAPATATSYLIKQGFEGTGYDNSELWQSDSGAPFEDPDDTTFGVDGSQNLALGRTSTSCDARGWFKNDGSGTNVSEVWFYCILKSNRTNSTHSIIDMRTNNTVKGFIQIAAGGALKIWDTAGSTSASTTGAMRSNVTTHIWAHWKNSDGSGDVEFATDPTRTNSGACYAALSGGQTGMQQNQVGFQLTPTVSTNLIDKVRVSRTSIGSSPP